MTNKQHRMTITDPATIAEVEELKRAGVTSVEKSTLAACRIFLKAGVASPGASKKSAADFHAKRCRVTNGRAGKAKA